MESEIKDCASLGLMLQNMSNVSQVYKQLFQYKNNFIRTMRLRLAEIKNNLRTSSGWGKRGNVLSWNFIESCKIVEQQQSWLLQPVGEDCERGQNAQCLVISTEIFSKYRRLGLFSMPCFSKRNKNKLRTNWGWSSQKIKNNKPRQNLLVHIKKIACT